MFSARLLEYFEHPKYAGELASATSRVTMTNPVCGDVLELQMEVRDGLVVEARFRAKGCVPSMACAAALAEALRGMSLAEAAELSAEDVERLVDGVPSGSAHAIQLAVDALAESIKTNSGMKATHG